MFLKHPAQALLVLILCAVIGVQQGAACPVGARDVAAGDPMRPLALRLWYPATPGGTPRLFGATPVFAGETACADTPIAPGPHGLVMIAFGGMRSAPGMANWLARRLAESGLIAVTVRGPRLRPEDAAKAPAEVWKRPADLSAALDAVQAAPGIAPVVDKSRIGALGVFLGGTSATQLVGAQMDPARYAASCDPPQDGPDCAWYRKAGVSLHKIDLSPMLGSRVDPRVRAAVAISPELTEEFAPDSLKDRPITVLELGAAAPPSLGALGGTISDVTRFSAFAGCTAKGRKILGIGTPEPICATVPGRSRRDAHARIAQRSIAALKTLWARYDSGSDPR